MLPQSTHAGVVAMSFSKLVKNARAGMERLMRGLAKSYRGRFFHSRQIVDVATREAFGCASVEFVMWGLRVPRFFHKRLVETAHQPPS
jgi:hypothetical protein